MRVLPDRRPRLALESHVRHAFQTLRVTSRHELASWTAREHEADRSPRYLDDWRCIGRWQTHPPLPQLPWGHPAPSKIGAKDRVVAGVVDLTATSAGRCMLGCWTSRPAGPGRHTRPGCSSRALSSSPASRMRRWTRSGVCQRRPGRAARHRHGRLVGSGTETDHHALSPRQSTTQPGRDGRTSLDRYLRGLSYELWAERSTLLGHEQILSVEMRVQDPWCAPLRGPGLVSNLVRVAVVSCGPRRPVGEGVRA
jgi:hypothetical protein